MLGSPHEGILLPLMWEWPASEMHMVVADDDLDGDDGDDDDDHDAEDYLILHTTSVYVSIMCPLDSVRKCHVTMRLHTKSPPKKILHKFTLFSASIYHVQQIQQTPQVSQQFASPLKITGPVGGLITGLGVHC